MTVQEEIRWSGVERRRLGCADADWPAAIEDEKAALARTLHDRTGAMLVAARMDIDWSERNVNLRTVRTRLLRARTAIDEVIDLNRRIVEDLHPSLLDTIGLPAALRWHMAGISRQSGIECSANFPESLPDFSSRPATALYRIAQILLRLLVTQGSKSVSFTLASTDRWVILSLVGVGIVEPMMLENEASRNALALVRSHLRAFKGDLSHDLAEGALHLRCRLPARVALEGGASQSPAE